MGTFEETLRAINAMKEDGVIEDYAIAEAMAMAFWTEAIPTYDLDVLVTLPSTGKPLVSLEPIYRWASEGGYPVDREHVIVENTPVQFLPVPNELAAEAVARASASRYGDVSTRVVRAEYLIALFLHGSARTAQRRERAIALRDRAEIDQALLHDLLDRFKLTF